MAQLVAVKGKDHPESPPDVKTPDLGAFTTASNNSMVVVTAGTDTERSGCLVGFHTQCSIQPPRYAVMISKVNHTYRVALGTTTLAVNLLRSDQRALGELFGGFTADDAVDKFERCGWTADATGVPVLDDAFGFIVGGVTQRVDVGDHVLHVLNPLSVSIRDGADGPLRYRSVSGIEPGHPD